MRWSCVLLASVLLASQQGLWIDVPYVRQEKNGCGSACLWMVMRYWKPDATPPVDEIQEQLYSAQARGIFAQDVRKYLETHGYRVITFRGEWDDFSDNVSKGRPLIVCLGRSAGAPLHYVVVAGLDSAQGTVLVNDPADRKLVPMRRADFERRWKTTGNWTLLAVPETHLASSSFRQGDLPETRKHLVAALRSGPADPYLNEFLATVYFLQDNQLSALKYWNRGGIPFVDRVRIDPPLLSDPLLLDRILRLSQPGVLTVDQFRTIRARIDAARIFSNYGIELSPADAAGDRFDATLRATDRHGTNPLTWLRGVPYQTIFADYANIGYRAIDADLMVRWDPHKVRIAGSLSEPLGRNPKWRIRFGLDRRDEDWTDGKTVFRMNRAETAAEIHSVPSGRWDWTGGVAFTQRNFSNTLPGGLGLKSLASATQHLLQDTDRQLNLDTSWSLQAGSAVDFSRQRFCKVENTTSVSWRPPLKHPDYEVSLTTHLGRIFGNVPFDELFVMGIDRDFDLMLRAHSTTLSGIRSVQFVGRSLALANADFQRVLYKSALFRFSAGPFADAGIGPISPNPIVDIGAQLRITVLRRVTLSLSYGKSLTDSSRAFFLR